MDFGFTKEQEELRREVYEFYLNELPSDYDRDTPAINKELQDFYIDLQKKLAERGWLAAGIPKEYGGLGLGNLEHSIINEVGGYWVDELRCYPDPVGVHMAAPALLLFGTEEQKKRFIPPIARGEVGWMQTFTEPDAGTDESNIQCRAVADGDDFIINGQKTYCSGTFKPDYLYAQLRTADTTPKHRGLTLFLIPADLPGITFRPLACMGDHCAHEVFFDNVRLPKEYMIGQLNQGFYNAMTTLEFERSDTGQVSGAKRDLEEFIQFCKEEKMNGKPLIDDPKVRDALAQMAINLEVWRLAAWRTAWWFGQREKLGPLSYDLSGLYWKTFVTRHSELMMDILGLYGQLRKGSKWAKLNGQIERQWQYYRSFHASGTIEVYKIVLAGRGLGLPRIPANMNSPIMEALQKTKK